MFTKVFTALFTVVSFAAAASIPGFPGMPSSSELEIENSNVPIVGNNIPTIINSVVAGTANVRRQWGDNSCNTGPVQCCQNIQDSDDPMASQLLALLGVQVQDVNVPVGFQCNPITGIGAGSASCEAEPVCCENNNYQGLIALGCLPVNVGL